MTTAMGGAKGRIRAAARKLLNRRGTSPAAASPQKRRTAMRRASKRLGAR